MLSLVTTGTALPNRLAVIRAARGISGAGLARTIGVHPSLVSKVEHGRIEAWPVFRRRAAEALGVDVALIFPGADA